MSVSVYFSRESDFRWLQSSRQSTFSLWLDFAGVGAIPLIDESLFETVQQQLKENKQRARQQKRGARHLLQGLVVCKCCGYAYYGKPVSNKAANGKKRNYAYYRCIGTDGYRFGGQPICTNKQVRTDHLEAAVWKEVCTLLENPQRLEQEYYRRQQAPTDAKQQTLSQVETQIAKLRRGMGRLIDSYAEGFIEKADFEPRIQRLKARLEALETQRQQAAEEVSLQQELRLIIGRLEDFSHNIKQGLDQVDWHAQRELIRTLVKQVEIDHHQVNVVFRVEPSPALPELGKDCLQHCGRRDYPALRDTFVRGLNLAIVHHACFQPCFTLSCD